MSKKNIDKTWRDIIQEIEKDAGILWHYITALRGPDVDLPYIKEIFTCPLRGRCVQALDVEEYLALTEEVVIKGFTIVLGNKQKLSHYIYHIQAIWNEFYTPIARLLEEVFFRGDIAPITGATHYIKLLNEWFENENAIMCKKGEINERYSQKKRLAFSRLD